MDVNCGSRFKNCSSGSKSYGVMSPPKGMEPEFEIAQLRTRTRWLIDAKNALWPAIADRGQITADEQQWMMKANEVINEANELIHVSKSQENKGWFIRAFPIFNRNNKKLRNEAAIKASIIVELLNECKLDQNSSANDPINDHQHAVETKKQSTL